MKYSSLLLIFVMVLGCNKPVARRPINKQLKSKKDYTVEFNKVLNKAQEQEIKEYVKKDSLLSYKNSSFGFVYAVLNKSNKLQNKVKEGVELTYLKTVYSLKNKLIYSEKEVISVLGKSNEITGIQEGLKLMKEDEEIKFIFTSFVAHGFYGDKNKIGRHMPIIVKIKLLKINN